MSAYSVIKVLSKNPKDAVRGRCQGVYTNLEEAKLSKIQLEVDNPKSEFYIKFDDDSSIRRILNEANEQGAGILVDRL